MLRADKKGLAREAGIDVEATGADCLLADQSGGGGPKVASGEAGVVTASSPPDYPGASWNPAAYWNYWDGRTDEIDLLVIHTVQGSYASCINWFKNEAADVSAHYVISSGGAVTQMVRNRDTAWHVGAANPRSIGTEHEGWVDDGTPPSEAMLQSSARLHAYLCKEFGRDPNRHIVGHRDVPGQTHTDPGNEWPMARFRQLVKSFMGVRTPTPEAPVLTPLWVNWAYLTRWGKKQAEACVAALHKNDYAKTLPTKNVIKAADDALDGVKGNHPCIVLGRNTWKVLPDGQRSRVESAMEDDDPYRYDLWYADSGQEVRWRLAKVARLCGLNVGEVLADYKAELDGETPETPAGIFKPGPDTGKAHMRGAYNLVGAERYSFTKLKAWAKTHGAHKRVYEFIDAVEKVWKEAWPIVGAPMYAADIAIVQFCHETGFGHYRGDSAAWNPAGIKKAGARGDTPADFEVPATAYEGARMLLNHMSIYIGGKPFGKVHGRYTEVKPIRWKSATTVDGLTGTWATDPKYATILRKYLGELEGAESNVRKYDKAHDYLMACLGGPYVPWVSGPFTAFAPAWVRPTAPPAGDVAWSGAFCAFALTGALEVLGLPLPTPDDPEWEGGLLDYGKDWIEEQGLAVVYRPGMRVNPMDAFIVKYTGPALVKQGHTWVVGKNGKMIQWDGSYGGNNRRTLEETIRLFSHGKTVYLIRREKWIG